MTQAPQTKVLAHPGMQILRENNLEDAFKLPTTHKTTAELQVATPKSTQVSIISEKRTVLHIANNKVSAELKEHGNVKDFIVGANHKKINEVQNNSHWNQNRETPKPLEEQSNRKAQYPVKGLDLDTVDIAREDVRNLRFPHTNPPWFKTMKPVRPEDYAKNCSEGSFPIQGSSFHTKSFCLVDDDHEYFGVYGNQVCYHRGTNNPKTRRRIKKHKTCECNRGWYGKYCSMPDVAFNGGYPYEHGIEIQRPPRRLMFAFPFNGEFAMMETAVMSLHKAVDAFLILESNYTAAGHPKERELLKKLQEGYLREFQYKIVYISLDFFPKAAYANGWVIDALLRNHIGEVAFGSILENVRDDDIIVSADADEVMTEEALMFLRLHYGYPEPFGFVMRHTVFGYFWQAPDGVTNSYGGSSVALLRGVLGGKLYDIRNAPKNVAKDGNFLRKFRRMTGVKVRPWLFGSKIHPAGWHCSWCFLPPGIRAKLISAHASDFPRWGTFTDKTNLPFITKLVRNGTWFDEKTHLKYIYDQFSEFYAPRYIKDNEKSFGYLLEHSVYMQMSQKYLKPTESKILNENMKDFVRTHR